MNNVLYSRILTILIAFDPSFASKSFQAIFKDAKLKDTTLKKMWLYYTKYGTLEFFENLGHFVEDSNGILKTVFSIDDMEALCVPQFLKYLAKFAENNETLEGIEEKPLSFFGGLADETNEVFLHDKRHIDLFRKLQNTIAENNPKRDLLFWIRRELSQEEITFFVEAYNMSIATNFRLEWNGFTLLVDTSEKCVVEVNVGTGDDLSFLETILYSDIDDFQKSLTLLKTELFIRNEYDVISD